jgi:signal transduction histidine kinase
MLRSIRSRLIALVLAVALPLLALLVWVFWAEVSRVHNSARDLALRIARSLSADLGDADVRSNALLSRMAVRPKVLHANSANCDSLFAIVDLYPQYLNLVLFDMSGAQICSATPSIADAKISAVVERIISARLRSTGFRNLEPLVLPIAGKWIAIDFQPIVDHGTTTGALALEQYLDLDVTAFPVETIVTIVDAKGRIIAGAPDGNRWVGQDFRPSAIAKIASDSREGRAQARGVDGVMRQYGFTRVHGRDWTVFVGIPAGVGRAAVRTLIVRGLASGLVICAIVLLLALHLAKTIKSPLDVLARAAKTVADDGYVGGVPAGGPREIELVGQAFNHMIERRSEAENALDALSKKLLDVQEEERSRIAREIHDELGQLLTALNMDIGGLLKTAEPLNPDQKTMARRIRQALMQTISSVQRISAELRPAALDDFGLVAAIESDVNTFEERTGVECHLSFPSDDTLSFGSDVDAAFYRIAQEAMTNVARHSDATRLEITLRRNEGFASLEIRDDGNGIPPDKVRDPGSLGIIGMRERARKIGASVEVVGEAGRGTTVSVRIPLPAVRAVSS